MRRYSIALCCLFAFLMLSASTATLASGPNDHAAHRSSCDDPGPYWFEHEYAHSGPFTFQDAVEFCRDRLEQSSIFGHAGFIIRWFGGEAPGNGETGYPTCFACVSPPDVSHPFTHSFPPTRTSLDDAINLATSIMPGEVAKVELFTFEDLDSGTMGAGYEVTIFDIPTRRRGVVRIDPLTGDPSIVVDGELVGEN